MDYTISASVLSETFMACASTANSPTSKKMGSEVLSYDPVLGVYVGCVPLSEEGNAWNE